LYNMFNDTALSTDNYDKTLIGWKGLSSLKSNVYFGANNSTFCTSESERNFLISKGWKITDAGKDCSTSTLSLDEVIENSFQIYPNPILNYLEIKPNNNLDIKYVKVYNLQGKLIKESTKKRIDLSGLSTGTYVVKVKTNLGVYSKKIIKN
jgi:hypothetical protein